MGKGFFRFVRRRQELPPATVRTYYYFEFQRLKLKRTRPAGPVKAKPKNDKPPRLYTWTCQYCGQPFETEIYSQRYCNPTHKKYAQRERRNK
jgi:hypothetical protein